MNTKFFTLSILAIILSFVGGFFLANSLNKNELEKLRIENNRLQSGQTNTPQDREDLSVSDEDIRQRIAEADQNPGNLQIQKDVGIALYQYAAAKKNTKLMSETARLLLRAYEKNPADTDVIVTLGHLYYDIGYFEKDNKSFAKAREFYQKILAKMPDNIDVRTDYGLTYFLQNPPEYDKAVAEFQRSLETNPKHTKTLQFLIQTLIKQEKTREAETYLARLKEVDPNTPSLSEIQKQIAEEENNPSQ